MKSLTGLVAWRAGVGAALLFFGMMSHAQTAAPAQVAAVEPVAQRSVSDWLLRMHQASRQRAYVGTFVVSTGRIMSSARIWHVCDGEQQVERVESLTGVPRSTFRHNDQVTTFLPQSRVVITEKRESLGLFPSLLKAKDTSIAQFYRAQLAGSERVAGYAADVMLLKPVDNWRFGYRVWSEKSTGLVVKLQTLDSAGQVLEQAAFSELQLGAPVSMAGLSQLMGRTEGYRIERPSQEETSAEAQGWRVKSGVPGFMPMSCYRRSLGRANAAAPGDTLQLIFSDGLASVSLFVEPFDAQRHTQPGGLAVGATHVLTQHSGNWWLSAVGEVPQQTLAAFAKGLERKP